MRTFLALRFSVAMGRRIAEQMEKEAQRFREGPLAAWKLAWVPPANYHLTLKFFGEIPAEAVDAISLRLRQRLAEQPPITLRAKGYGVFPGEGAPRVLWVGIQAGRASEGKGPLEQLHATVEREMEDLGFVREARPFHPHLTVARVIEGDGVDGSWVSEIDFGEESISELSVYESRSLSEPQIKKPSRVGVEYVARARVPFLRK